MGLGHLAVEDRDEYLARALRWGQDRDARDKAKAEILANKNLLFESDESVREYSSFMLSHAF
jgi:predicted O-linked N-acetylglucosamine transferase (SPINDLY family)